MPEKEPDFIEEGHTTKETAPAPPEGPDAGLLPDPLSDDRERDALSNPLLALCVVLVALGNPVSRAVGLLGPMLWLFYIMLFFCFFYAFKLRDDRRYALALLTMAVPYIALPILKLIAG